MTKRWALIIGVLFLLILGIGGCYIHKVKSDYLKAAEAAHMSLTLQDSLLQTKIKEVRDSSGRQIQVYRVQAVTAEQLAYSKSTEAEQLRKDLHRVKASVKDLISTTSVESTTGTVFTQTLHDTIPCTDTGDIPTIQFSDSTKWHKVFGLLTFSRAGRNIVLDNVYIEDSVHNKSSITHYSDGGLFRPTHVNLMITQDNPSTITGKVQNYDIYVPKKWYEKWWVHTAAGAVLGGYATYRLIR